MKQNFDKSLDRVLQDEGGYSNDPHDPGGPTNFGITLADYKLYINPNGTAEDVKGMKIEQAKSIYKAKYWDALRCDDLPSGVDYVVFDYGVNSGVSRSARVLQNSVVATADGKIGPETITQTKKQDPKTLINTICDERMTFLKSLSTWQYFGKGWTKRVEGGRKFALELASSNVGPGAGAAAGAGIVALLAQYFHEHAWAIGLTGAVVIIAGILIYHFKRNKTNVVVE